MLPLDPFLRLAEIQAFRVSEHRRKNLHCEQGTLGCGRWFASRYAQAGGERLR